MSGGGDDGMVVIQVREEVKGGGGSRARDFSFVQEFGFGAFGVVKNSPSSDDDEDDGDERAGAWV